MDSRYNNTLKLLYKLTRSIVALPAFFCIFLLLFYITGNFQGFQDSTQQIILNTLGISSIFFTMVSLFGFIQSIVLFFIPDVISRKKNFLFMLLMIFCLILAIFFVVMSLVMNVLIKGL